jgi:hypothetical protein
MKLNVDSSLAAQMVEDGDENRDGYLDIKEFQAVARTCECCMCVCKCMGLEMAMRNGRDTCTLRNFKVFCAYVGVIYACVCVCV